MEEVEATHIEGFTVYPIQHMVKDWDLEEVLGVIYLYIMNGFLKRKRDG
jgi:hypothetical protein